MQTEQVISIRETRKTLNQVKLEIPKYAIGNGNREILEQTAVVLEGLIWHLAHEDLTRFTESLKNHRLRLEELHGELKSETDSLKKVIDMIEKVSQMIGSLSGFAG